MSSTMDRRQRRCGASEWGKSERVRGMVRWGICSAAARERRERRALSRALHGGGEVAADGRFCAAWQSGGERQREGQRAVERFSVTRGTAQQAGGGRAGPPRRPQR